MKRYSWSYGIELCMIVLLALSFKSHHSTLTNDKVILADGKGYYAYLPAIFIYHDPAFSFIDQVEKKYYDNKYADFRTRSGNAVVDKYFSGEALLLLPFFLIAHLLAKLLHLQADGYSFIYQMAVAVGAVCYLYIGSKALFRYYYNLSGKDFISFFIVFLLLFGTNLYYYSMREPSMSHVYSFALFSIFCLGAYRIFITGDSRWIIPTIAVTGLIMAVRPVNIIILGMIPVIAGSWNTIKRGINFITGQKGLLFSGVALAAIPLLLQCLLWYWQCGHFLVYSYGKEGFNWGNPYMFRVLFSFHKGWFVWTPLAFVGVVGLVCWIRKDSFRAISSLIFLLAVTYVASCWWIWSYADSFGAREFIEFLIVPGLGLLYLFKIRWFFVRAILFIVSLFLVGINLVQAYQYQHFILLWDGTDPIDYKRVFLKTAPVYESVLWHYADKQVDSIITKNIRCSVETGYENQYDISYAAPENWYDKTKNAALYPPALSGDLNADFSIYRNGKASAALDMQHQVTPVLSVPLLDGDSLIQASLWFYGQMPHGSKVVLLLSRNDNEIMNKSELLLAYYFHTDKWTPAVIHLMLPHDVRKGDRINVFVTDNNSGDRLFIDDMKVEVISPAKLENLIR